MSDDKPSLDAAYALETPEDSRRLYADWAETYESEFAVGMDYLLPQAVAAALMVKPEGPLLDVGAGTELVAQALGPGYVIDALDISPQMLAVAQAKGLYRRCIEGDLTGRLAIADETYAAVLSAGTFTHGHVGPDALDELLRVAQPGAFFALSVNAEHFEARGFAAKFEDLSDRLVAFSRRAVPIYGQGADAGHAEDRAEIVSFRKR
ncbi:MAG: class I SAM-dependent methyltransferase [Sulfitobacter sp.]|nr:class I SAM-dependent methyltransferase [Sulfitobacter sp.]